MGYVLIGMFAFAVGAISIYLLTEKKRKANTADADSLAKRAAALNEAERSLSNDRERIAELQQQFETRVLTYDDLKSENDNLRTIQRSLAQNVRKQTLDMRAHQTMLEEHAQRADELGRRYLQENVKWIGKNINATNYAASKQKLLQVIERCRGIGFAVSAEDELSLLSDLKKEFERAVRIAIEKEEQARIKAQIREEKKLEKEIERELDRVERERQAVEAALEIALAKAHGEHTAEVESLRARLAEAEASKRAISQAQLTKAGYVYVISNIGSFGEGVYKIGMTRRLTPNDRVRELGDASVPFPFDVHMMISAENAPQLENHLHRTFKKRQLNRVNPRKEFFRLDLQEIVEAVRDQQGEIEYEANPEALEYRQSLALSDEDQDYIEHVYDEVEGSVTVK